jgi:hypothetical protein
MKIISIIGLAFLLFTCSQHEAPTLGVWKYNHDRTKGKISEVLTAQKLKVSDSQLDKIVVHFKQHPPELELKKDGTFVMRRLHRSNGAFSGKFKLEGDSLKLDCGGSDCGWPVSYNSYEDEYTVLFMVYPIVLSRE